MHRCGHCGAETPLPLTCPICGRKICRICAEECDRCGAWVCKYTCGSWASVGGKHYWLCNECMAELQLMVERWVSEEKLISVPL